MKNIYLDYNSIALRIEGMAEGLKQHNFNSIVIVLRGGSFAGMHLSFLTGLPCFFLTYDRKNNRVDWHGSIPAKGKVLLVEDFAGLGRTLIDCRNFLLNTGFDVKTFVICKDLKSASIPDFHCFNTMERDTRFILPWERYRINKQSSGISKKDHEFERSIYDFSIDKLLQNEDDAYIEFSNNFLCVYNKKTEILYINEVGNLEKREERARIKGKTAIHLGYTHIFLEDVKEAIYIAELFPELRVIWWDGGARHHIQSTMKNSEKVLKENI
ncbi:phosphoribosyltransferase [Bacillus sp. ISL-55]|uniref:phosphoribosyltransferase n=1 Tax=Bacillus sp. ISL-55 TaxID=2819134 RepID=UPI001BEB82C4|nr:phosphoribosyltransferase [Bacillus sp. ISL-55]MBT2692562.1 hypothetical protein [Bacillus sp. ISL-55]